MSSNRGRPWGQKFGFFGKIESAKEENDLHLVNSVHAYKVCGLTLYYLKIYQKKVRRRLVIRIMNCSVSLNLRKGQKKKSMNTTGRKPHENSAQKIDASSYYTCLMNFTARTVHITHISLTVSELHQHKGHFTSMQKTPTWIITSIQKN